MADYLLENSEQTIIAILVDRRLRFWEEINKDLVAWMLKHAFFFNPNYDPWDYRFEIGLHRGNLTIQSVQFQERNDKQEHTWDSVNPRQQFTYSIVLLKTDPVYSITSVKPGMQLLRPQAEEMCPEWLAVAAHISAYHDLNRLSISTKLALLHSALLIQRQACESRFKNFETPPIGSEFAINIRALSGWIQTLRSIDLWTPIVESGGVESVMEESLDKQHDKQRTE
ncbi:hypothetical protein FRC17_002409 [Serendipita sp. 399]|nr:hypothetical protein FRC17_002409 [Serendipita sp. 399]